MTFSSHVVGIRFDNTEKLMTGARPSPEAMLNIRKKIVCFGELLKSLDDFLSDLTERRKETDWPITVGKLYFSLITTLMTLQWYENKLF